MPCVLKMLSHVNVSCKLTCSCANVPWVLTCFCVKCLRAFVLKGLRAWVLASLVCQRTLRAYMLTWQRALRAYVHMCQRTSRVNTSCVLMYSGLKVVCELKCSCVNILWVPCLTRLVWPHDHLPTCFASSVSSFNATFFSFVFTFIEVVHIADNV